mmetsp:Transcript_5644/g.11202  ORF Transcript_5644/g.11202 Transcript_5644/m.11202 type:complete len:139 (-) Transcript_5644:1471-1887(-)
MKRQKESGCFFHTECRNDQNRDRWTVRIKFHVRRGEGKPVESSCIATTFAKETERQTDALFLASCLGRILLESLPCPGLFFLFFLTRADVSICMRASTLSRALLLSLYQFTCMSGSLLFVWRRDAGHSKAHRVRKGKK